MNSNLKIPNQTVSKFLIKVKPLLPILQHLFANNITVFCVGGACRDLLLGKGVKDLDLEVYNTSLPVLETLLRKFTKTCAVGNRFLVIKTPRLDCDWALARTDGIGRSPEVKLLEGSGSIGEFSVDQQACLYAQAAIRRDLTINSMGIDLGVLASKFAELEQKASGDHVINWVEEFQVKDPFGGLKDLENKTLRAVDAEFFSQDPLRFFRVAQFYSRLGFSPHQSLTDICRKMPIELTNTQDTYFCPSERIGEEICKLLRSTAPSLGLKWLMSTGRWTELLKGLENLDKSPEEFLQLTSKLDLIAQQASQSLVQAGLPEQTVEEQLFYSLAILVQGTPAPEEFLRFSRIDKQTIGKISKMLKLSERLTEVLNSPNKDNVEHDLQLLAKSAFPELKLVEIIFLHCTSSITTFTQQIQRLVNLGQSLNVLYQPIPALVNGNDIMALGITGAQVKTVLEQAYLMQIKQKISEKEILLGKLKNL